MSSVSDASTPSICSSDDDGAAAVTAAITNVIVVSDNVGDCSVCSDDNNGKSSNQSTTINDKNNDNDTASSPQQQASPLAQLSIAFPSSPPSTTSSSQPPPSMDKAMSLKEEGNAHFRDKNYESAIVSYELALREIPNDDDDDDDDDNSCTALKATLRSNLALMFQKCQRWDDAEENCHKAMLLDETNAKLHYRRADIRYRKSPADLNGAQMDIERCLSLLQREKKTKKGSDIRMAQSLRTLIKKSMSFASKAESVRDTTAATTSAYSQTKTNGHNNHNHNQQHKPSPKIPSPSQQKTDMIKLLTQSTSRYHPGEAYFLIHLPWLRQWCNYVSFTDHYNKFFIPPPSKRQPSSSTSSSTSSSSSSSSSSDIDHPPSPPGPIDNTPLLNTPTKHSSMWLSHYHLKPTLIRGHHYEILPREAYHALTCWYSSITEPICRRVYFDDHDIPRIRLHDDMLSENDDALSRRQQQRRSCAACDASKAQKTCHGCRSVYYCDRECQESHWGWHKEDCRLTKAREGKGGGRRKRGECGLTNLGNTCFMNAALQCLSHCTPLTAHFLSNSYLHDLNPSNPLSTPQNRLATSYNTLLRALHFSLSSTAPHSPTPLKRAIALYAPRFAGRLQHDAQEFLAYLLDGLHEDLNRVREKPYEMLPDYVSGGGGGRGGEVIAGAEAWSAYERRNDSAVWETFYGMFKSACVCPKCERTSVSFDAFNHVSLEIPVESMKRQHRKQLQERQMDVWVWGRKDVGGGEKIRVMVDREGCVEDLKEEIEVVCGPLREGKQLLICDVYQHSIYDIMKDNKALSSIRNDDLVVAYVVDGYLNDNIHALVTHVYDDSEMAIEELKLMGFPLLISFPSCSTCQQISELICNNVKGLMDSSKSDDGGHDDTNANGHRNNIHPNFQIHVVDHKNKPLPIFNTSSIPSSILPTTSEQTLPPLLGDTCTESFLFLSLCHSQPLPNLPPSASLTTSPLSSPTTSFSSSPPISSTSPLTLHHCLSHFTTPERLDENNKWYCSHCRTHVRALKTMQLFRCPNVLIIHLKRFAAGGNSGGLMGSSFAAAGLLRGKLEDFVDCGMTLDVSDFIALDNNNSGRRRGNETTTPEDVVHDHCDFVVNDQDHTYDLFGVINHYGRMGMGHYTAYARSWNDRGDMGEWKCYDDGVVGSVRTVVTDKAYVLFYKRRMFA